MLLRKAHYPCEIVGAVLRTVLYERFVRGTNPTLLMFENSFRQQKLINNAMSFEYVWAIINTIEQGIKICYQTAP